MSKENNIDLIFQETVSPHNFSDNFKNDNEFLEYLKNGDKANLEFTLQVYVDIENYELAALIKKQIDSRWP